MNPNLRKWVVCMVASIVVLVGGLVLRGPVGGVNAGAVGLPSSSHSVPGWTTTPGELSQRSALLAALRTSAGSDGSSVLGALTPARGPDGTVCIQVVQHGASGGACSDAFTDPAAPTLDVVAIPDSHGSLRAFGAVPDSVRSVSVTTSGGLTLQGDVNRNLFYVDTPRGPVTSFTLDYKDGSTRLVPWTG
jgi:hypothetical protein